MATQLKKSSDKVLRTFWVGFVAIITLFSVFLGYFQLIDGGRLAAESASLRTFTYELRAKRGDIVDTKGTVLATTVQTYDIAVNQNKIRLGSVNIRNSEGEIIKTEKGVAAIARHLAPLLGKNEAELGGQLIGDSNYHYLAKKVPVETWRKIRGFNIYGIEWEESFQRLYPGESVAATVIGSLNYDGEGNSGIELTQEALLKGKNGTLTNEYSPKGQVLPGGKSNYQSAENGQTVHLTIDGDLQHRVEELLNQVARRNGAQAASVVITEVKTGNILVLADAYNKPISNQPQTSKAIQYAAEPGSVGKVYTMASGLEKGVITPLSPIPVPDTFTASNGQQFKDAEYHGYQLLTAAGVLANSSNTGTIFVGQQVPDQERYELQRRLGLGKLTNIELPGESPGLLPPPQKWDGRQKYVNMFGQAYSVNQLQLVNSFAAIGNGGVYLPLRLIEGYTLPDGTYQKVPLKKAERAIKAEAAQDLLRMMETVSAEGSGKHFQLPGYRMALKTGTAEVFEGGRYVGNSLNITGVVPAQDPQLAIGVHMYRPNTNNYASVLLAQLYKDVTAEAVRARNIPASDSSAQAYPIFAK